MELVVRENNTVTNSEVQNKEEKTPQKLLWQFFCPINLTEKCIKKQNQTEEQQQNISNKSGSNIW